MYEIDKNINNAIEGKSKLTEDILSLDGMSSARVRHLLNNFADNSNVNYLEIGICQGSTFISALYGNKTNSAYAIDNWSEFNDGSNRDIFIKNCQRFNINDFKLLEYDAFQTNLNKIKHAINLYFYDGNHSIEATANALNYFYPILADEFIFIVDDYGWVGVAEGVYNGIEKCKLEILNKRELEFTQNCDKDAWWNGIGIFILKKW